MQQTRARSFECILGDRLVRSELTGSWINPIPYPLFPTPYPLYPIPYTLPYRHAGYIAASIIERLLVGGHTVHATVRDPSDTARLSHLLALPGAAERLQFFKVHLKICVYPCLHASNLTWRVLYDGDDEYRKLEGQRHQPSRLLIIGYPKGL